MPSPKPAPASRGRRSARTAGAIGTSVSGTFGSVAIGLAHGSTPLGVVIFIVAQAWGGVELACWWRLRWRLSRLQEDVARRALQDPENENLRTLMLDIAATLPGDPGDRLPSRPQLTQARDANRQSSLTTSPKHPRASEEDKRVP